MGKYKKKYLNALELIESFNNHINSHVDYFKLAYTRNLNNSTGLVCEEILDRLIRLQLLSKKYIELQKED